MVGRPESFIGNILFYDYLLYKRNPTFLNRNLTQALQLHQQELEQGCSNQAPRYESSRALWRMPSEQTLDKMIEDDEAKRTFLLKINGIGPLKLDKGSWGRPAKKKGLLFCLDVEIHITITDAASSTVLHRISNTTVKMMGTHSDKGKDVSLDMSRSVIKLDDLLRSRGIGEEPSWRKSKPTDWNLLISINFRSSNDAEEFYSHVASTESPLLQDQPTRLVSRWANILQCPEGVKVLPLAVGNGQQLDFGLEASMSWTASKNESILAGYNRQLWSAVDASKYPTPPPLEPEYQQRPDKRKFKLTFVYLNETLTRHGLQCPHDSCSRKSFSELDALRMHLETWHDMFKYRVKKEGEANGTQHWRFICDVADHKADQQRASNAAPDPREIQLLAPKKPFNRRKYLHDGNEEFQRAARLEKGSKLVAPQTSTAATPVIIQPKKPDDVLERTQVERRTYRVPKAPPDVTFFRSISKRPLQAGEYISESDDEVEMNWVQLKKDAQIDADSSISGPAKRFLRVFDTFIIEEQLQGEIHLGDAIIRFARAKAAVLWHEKITAEFRLKLDELLEDKIITKEIHAAALDIVKRNKPTQEYLSDKLAGLGVRRPSASLHLNLDGGYGSTTRKIDKGKGKAKVTDTGHITPQTAGSDGDVEMRDADHTTPSKKEPEPETPAFDQCLCGEDALGSSRGKAVIVCESLVSSPARHGFSQMNVTNIGTGLRAACFPHRMHNNSLETSRTTRSQDKQLDL